MKRAVGCAVLALLLWAPAAGAATTVNSNGFFVQVTGSAAADEIRVTVVDHPAPTPEFPFLLVVEDPLGVTPIGTCIQGATAAVAQCDMPPHGFDFIDVFGDDGNDKIAGSDLVESLYGGTGDDLIDGGAGDDFVSGGDGGSQIPPVDPGADQLYGGPGGDSLLDEDIDTQPGPDTLSGGSCPESVDAVFCASPGSEIPGDDDAVGYFRSVKVTLDLTSPAPIQGEQGENDTLLLIESALTGDGDDVVTGNGDVNNFWTGFGNDLVDVRGDDPNQDVVNCEDDTDEVFTDPADTTQNCETINGVTTPNPDEVSPPPAGGGGPVASGGSAATGVTTGTSPASAAKATIKGASSAGTVKVASNGSITLSKHVVQCPAGGVPCVVKTSLSGAVTASAKKKTVRLGGLSYALAAGKKGAVRLRLTKKGLRQLRRSKRVRGTVTITVTKGSAVTTKKVKVTLRAPKKK